MQYTTTFSSPLGEVLLACDESGLTGLWFTGQKYFAASLSQAHMERELPVLTQAKKWLCLYFSGTKPDFTPPLHPTGTAFQLHVWELLTTIGYGETATYGQIAALLQQKHIRASARAVGSAVGKNPISLIIPCHRVVGANGSLTGYAGGLSRKAALLKLEHSR